ncbi:MAG TPA: hypothetical protein DFR83_06960 [Deltaproteobacteria bacterium]|nr:hypothetical protein [Deltaproteobacteria bacterium]
MRTACLLLTLGLLACSGSKRLPDPDKLKLAVSTTKAHAEVRFRPRDAPDGIDAHLVSYIPDGQWDAGLDQATHLILKALVDERARITTPSVSASTAQAGFPGQARFLRRLNGGAFPNDLVERILRDGNGRKIDLGVASRTFSDGRVLWVVGWAPHLADLDPLPRDLQLDDNLPIRVISDHPGPFRLFVTPPDGPVQEHAISAEASRWVDVFHAPGAYRIEVVGDRNGRSDVLLLFTVFVDTEPERVPMLAWHPREAPNPTRAERLLFEALNEARLAHGLQPVASFDLFRPLAREHAAYMASAGRLGHILPGLTSGVPNNATKVAHPQAQFYENVAVAITADDAHALVEDSPGHFRNLLCEPCTHATVGVALEPVLDRPPRLFVAWELMWFPNGEPQPLPEK